VPLQHHRIPLLLGCFELTDRVDESVGDLETVLVDDHGMRDALAGEAREFGLRIMVPVVEQYEVLGRDSDPDRTELPVDASKTREEGRLRSDGSELLATTHCRLVAEGLILREGGHRRTGGVELVVVQETPDHVRDAGPRRTCEEITPGAQPRERAEHVAHAPTSFPQTWLAPLGTYRLRRLPA
jgi:hypothetical protein